MSPKQRYISALVGLFCLCSAVHATAHSPFTASAMSVIDASIHACGSSKVSMSAPDRAAALAEVSACSQLIDAASPHDTPLERASALDERARTYVIIGDLQKALADNDAAIALEPSIRDHYLVRLWIDLYLRRFDTLIDDAGRGLAKVREDPVLLAYRSWSYFYVRNYDAAIEGFARLIRHYPTTPAFYNGRCEALALEGQEQDALKACSFAVTLPLSGRNVVDTLGYVYLRLRRWQDAAIQYGQVRRMEPNSAKALYGLGLAKSQMGDVAQSGGAADIDAAKRIDPQIVADFARDP